MIFDKIKFWGNKSQKEISPEVEKLESLNTKYTINTSIIPIKYSKIIEKPVAEWIRDFLEDDVRFFRRFFSNTDYIIFGAEVDLPDCVTINISEKTIKQANETKISNSQFSKEFKELIKRQLYAGHNQFEVEHIRLSVHNLESGKIKAVPDEAAYGIDTSFDDKLILQIRKEFYEDVFEKNPTTFFDWCKYLTQKGDINGLIELASTPYFSSFKKQYIAEHLEEMIQSAKKLQDAKSDENLIRKSELLRKREQMKKNAKNNKYSSSENYVKRIENDEYDAEESNINK